MKKKMTFTHSIKTILHKLPLVILGSLFLFSGCVEEKIDASFPVERLEDQINMRSGLSINIPIDRVQVDNQFGNIGDIQARTIGMVFRRLAEMLADVEIQRGQAGAIKMGPFQYTLNELEGVDFNYVKEILVQRVQLKIGPHHTAQKEDSLTADFNFIKGLEIYIRFDDETNSGTRPSQTDTQGRQGTDLKSTNPDGTGTDSLPVGPSDEDFKEAYLVLSYVKGQDPLGCAQKCIDLKIHRMDWKERLMKNKSFSVMVKVNADKAPKQQFSFVGFINVAVKLNLGL